MCVPAIKICVLLYNNYYFQMKSTLQLCVIMLVLQVNQN